MQSKAGWRVVLAILVLLAGTEFLWRGPVRFAQHRDFNDFISPYIQTGAWLQGTDPYSPANLVRLWPAGAQRPDFLATDLADGSLVYKRGIPTAYPLTCFVLLAPISILPWYIADALWLLVSLLAYSATVLSLLSLTDLRRSPQSMYAFLAIALALAPFQTGLATGSIVIVAVGLTAGAIWAARLEQNTLAGVLMALTIALKPQIGLPFLFYYVVRRKWRLSVVAIALVTFLSAIAMIRLRVGGAPWMQSYLYNNKVLFAPGSLGDFTELNPLHFGLINLQVPVYAILGNRNVANMVAVLIALTMGLVWLFLVTRAGSKRDELLELSALAVLSLLPVYHRLYDASLLVFPLAWGFVIFSGRLKVLAKGTLLLILPFLVPGGSVLDQLQHTSHLRALQHSRWWTEAVMPHQAWCLFFLSLILLQTLRLATAAPAEAGG